MSYNYLTRGLNYNITEEEYHHKVLKITAPKIKKLRKRLNRLHETYLKRVSKGNFDFIEYDIKHDTLTRQIEMSEKL